MEKPLLFVAQGEIGKVCQLWKSLYVLKHSPRAWFGKFNQSVEKLACKRVNLTSPSSTGNQVQVLLC